MPTNPRPWRTDEKWVQAICDGVARHSKAAFDQMIASRDARIAQLEHDLATVQAQLGKSLEEPK